MPIKYLSWESTKLAKQVHLESKNLSELIKIDGLWTRLCSELGWERALLSAGDDLAFKDLLAAHVPQFMREIAQAPETVSAPNLLVVADDIAGPAGLFIAPNTLENSLFDVYTTILGPTKPIVFHSDGDVGDLLGIVSQSGFTHIHLAGVGLSKLSELAGKAHQARLIPMGGYGVATADDPELVTTICRLQKSFGLTFTDDAGLTTADQIKKYLDLTTVIG